VFFLLNHGQGYTYDSVMAMTPKVRMDHTRRVYEKIKAENEAMKQAMSQRKRR